MNQIINKNDILKGIWNHDSCLGRITECNDLIYILNNFLKVMCYSLKMIEKVSFYTLMSVLDGKLLFSKLKLFRFSSNFKVLFYQVPFNSPLILVSLILNKNRTKCK